MQNFNKKYLLACGSLASLVVIGSACSSDGTPVVTTDETPVENPAIDETPGETPTTDEGTAATVAFTCDEIATKFVTRGSANADLADPEVSAVCVNDTVTVTSNAIPDFPYIGTSPGIPEPNIVDYVFPATPTPAELFTAIPIVGNIGVAINGVPMDGPTEGPGGDVNARPGGFVECGGHNGPSGYHYHLLGLTGSDYCLFSEADILAEPQLFGYAFDGYPIFIGNNLYRSSYFLSDESLFATDTWSAHTYSAGSGDLDECNGRVDEDGNYAYYTTDDFPYILGCFRGEVTLGTAEDTGGPVR